MRARPRSSSGARLALGLAVALAAPRAGAWCRTTWPHTRPGLCEEATPVSWSIACLGVHLNARGLGASGDAGADLDGVIRRAFGPSLAAWSGADCGRSRVPALQLVDAGDVDAELDLGLDGRNVLSVNRLWSPDAYHRPGTVAFTVVTTDVRTGSLLEADIELNARSMENPLGRVWDDGPTRWGAVDAPTVVLHEVGHLAGLWHSLEAGAVMEASMDLERRRRALTDDDRAGICAVYRDGPVGPRAGRCEAQRPVPWPAVTAGGGCSAGAARSRGVTAAIALALAGWIAARRRR